MIFIEGDPSRIIHFFLPCLLFFPSSYKPTGKWACGGHNKWSSSFVRIRIYNLNSRLRIYHLVELAQICTTEIFCWLITSATPLTKLLCCFCYTANFCYNIDFLLATNMAIVYKAGIKLIEPTPVRYWYIFNWPLTGYKVELVTKKRNKQLPLNV